MIWPEATLLTIPYSLNQARSFQLQTILLGLPEGTMDLDNDIRQQIAAYLAGAIDADDLFGFLVGCTSDITPSSPAVLRDVWGTALGALSEFSSGEIEETDVRNQLQVLISQQVTGVTTQPTVTFTQSWFDLGPIQTGTAGSEIAPAIRTSRASMNLPVTPPAAGHRMGSIGIGRGGGLITPPYQELLLVG
jgi:hypothetical protein